MKNEAVRELLYQALETELGGVQVYQTALRCVVNEDLKKEWEEYLEQTQNHVRIVENVFTRLGLDPEAEPPGRLVVRHIGESLVKAMEMALEAGKPEAAQLVAAECVVLAETKDHLNWELIGELAKKAKGEQGSALKEAHKEVEEEEDEHLYHTTGWSRELWIETLGDARRPPAPRGGKGSEDRHRRRPGEARPQGHAVGRPWLRNARRSGAGLAPKLYAKRSKTGTVHRHPDVQARPRAATSSAAPRARVRRGRRRRRADAAGPPPRGVTHAMRNVRPLLVALLLVPGVLIGIWIGTGSGQGTAPPRPAVRPMPSSRLKRRRRFPITRPEQRKTPHDQQDPGKTAPPAAATETQPDQGQGLGFDFARDPFNAKRPMQTAEEIMQADIAEKPAVTAAQRRLLESATT